MTKSRTIGLFSATACLLLSGCNSPLTGGASTTSQVEAITSARILRLYQAFAQTVVSNLTAAPTGTVLYDGNLYYYKATVSGTVTTITYYYDSGATISEGTVVATNTTTSGTTQTYSVVFNITAGTRPFTGTLNVSIASGNSPIITSGSVTENSTSGAFPLTVNITNTAGALSGTATGVAFGTSVAYTNLVGTTTGANAYTLTGTASLANITGTFNESINADGSGSVSLSDGTTLTWTSSGSGTLTIPNVNGTVNVANVDSGQ